VGVVLEDDAISHIKRVAYFVNLSELIHDDSDGIFNTVMHEVLKRLLVGYRSLGHAPSKTDQEVSALEYPVVDGYTPVKCVENAPLQFQEARPWFKASRA